MKQGLIEEIGKNQRLVIVRQLKKAGELCVKDLASRLGMSYMGVKQHCIELHRQGYLDTGKNRKAIGRPELLYRLSSKAHELFPLESNEFSISLLESARLLFGPTAPGKLLLLFFQQKTAEYRQKLGELKQQERAMTLTKLREREGYVTEFQAGDEFKIIERHTPISTIFEIWPEAQQMERGMFEKVLEGRVFREFRKVSGVYECVFRIIW
ncbi:MAG: hypothetical protein C5B47_08710 [Verrucomicrobia bacterium]|nr:MAG: hypothetical protein C5B47_08710 [Verrucomicrobiota bacterium]